MLAGEYAGTFRWSQKRDFVPLPPYTAPASLEGTWQDFFSTRFTQPDDPDSKVILDVPMIDGKCLPREGATPRLTVPYPRIPSPWLRSVMSGTTLMPHFKSPCHAQACRSQCHSC